MDNRLKRGNMPHNDRVRNNREPVREDLVIGRNPVLELLKSGRPVEAVYLQKGQRQGSVLKIIAMAREQGVPVKEAAVQKLDSLCANGAHQGIAAVTASFPYCQVEDILARAGGEPPFIVIADEIEDPHNLGAIIRTAEAAGAHGLILPKRRGAGLTFTVGKASAGAMEYLPVARVSNLAAVIDQLKKQGVWIYAADMDGQDWCAADLTGPMALVVGSEGRGVGRLIKEKCDFILSLPMRGRTSSLNASVAAGILLYEAARQRMGLQAR